MQHKKNVLRAVILYTVFVYACIHTVFMVLYSLISGRYETLNGFKILGIDLFFPSMSYGIGYFILSYMLLGGIGCIVYILYRVKHRS